jgi:hypothetical protein
LTGDAHMIMSTALKKCYKLTSPALKNVHCHNESQLPPTHFTLIDPLLLLAPSLSLPMWKAWRLLKHKQNLHLFYITTLFTTCYWEQSRTHAPDTLEYVGSCSFSFILDWNSFELIKHHLSNAS